MSYCRFSDGDVYAYPHVDGGFECCACRLAPLVKSIFTEGCTDHPLFGDIEKCDKCNGNGCEECMLPGNQRFHTRSEMIAHLQEHIEADHNVPSYAIEILKEELAREGEASTST